MDPNTPTAAKQAGFLREGFREIGRRFDRKKLRSQSRTLNRERGEAATRLGEKAWQEKVGLAELADLRAQLEGLDARTGALNATQAKLQEQKSSLETRQRDETAKHDARRKEVEAKKRSVDQSLAADRQRLNEQTRGVANLQTRLSSLATELSALEKPPASGAAQDTKQLAQRESRKQKLAAEQKSASEELAKANVNVQTLSAEVTRLEGESRQLAADIQKVESDRKAALAPLQAELKRVEGETSTAQKDAGSVAGGRRAALTQLGLALYERKNPEPALTAEMAEMAAIDGRCASTQSALDASLLLTHSMPRGTMLKFLGTFILVLLLLVGLAAGSFFAWTWWQHRSSGTKKTASIPEETVSLHEESNPYLQHPLAGSPAYVLADKLANAKSEEEVADDMLEAFKTIHLGVYTAGGEQILAGSERSDKDFYLYDFEVRILAHAFFEHNVTDFDDESAGLGAAILRLDHPKSFTPVLKQAIVTDYDHARLKPNDPSSFLILLVDGLARHQVNPYTLDELTSRPGKELYLDPLQAFLIMLDAFVPPPQKTAESWNGLLKAPWDEFGIVYAAGPCSAIKGNGEGGNWGRTAKNLGTMASAGSLGAKFAGAAGKGSGFLGKAGLALSTIGAIHDLLWLYAVTIHIEPEPYNLHWNHDGQKNTGKFLATVTYELKKPPQGPIPCGAAAGQTLPQAPKRLPGVQLIWDYEHKDCLRFKEQTEAQAKYMTGESSKNVPGSLSGSQNGLQTTTGPDGTSLFSLDVTCHCPPPPWQKVVSRRYYVMASERSVSAKLPVTVGSAELNGWAIAGMIMNRLPGGIEYLMGGKTGYAYFYLNHHLSSCAQDRPCPAQITAHVEYDGTVKGWTDDADGHPDSWQADLTASGNFTQKLNMRFDCPACPPEFDEVYGPAGGTPGSSSGSYKASGEEQYRSVPHPKVLWFHSVMSAAGGVDDAYTELADKDKWDHGPVVDGGLESDTGQGKCTTAGTLYGPTECTAFEEVDGLGMPDADGHTGLHLNFELHPEGDRPAAKAGASKADKKAAGCGYDFISSDWYGTNTTELKSGGRVIGYEITFDGEKNCERKPNKGEPGDETMHKHLRVTVRVSRF